MNKNQILNNLSNSLDELERINIKFNKIREIF